MQDSGSIDDENHAPKDMEMIASKETIADIIHENNDMLADCGAREASAEAFISWYNAVKNEKIDGIAVKEFDVLSIVDMFDQDLKVFTASC